MSRRPVSPTIRDVVILFLGAYLGVAYSEIFAYAKSTSFPTLGYLGAHAGLMILGFFVLLIILIAFERLGWVVVPRKLV